MADALISLTFSVKNGEHSSPFFIVSLVGDCQADALMMAPDACSIRFTDQAGGTQRRLASPAAGTVLCDLVGRG
ncbi:hypothetical protein GA0071314_2035 [Halomonas sp. HL-93]|nr:hypothetical protein GA0071314_2035 [Halomonas sp. HL-93]